MTIYTFFGKFNNSHVAIGLFIFVTGTVVHWLHGLDAAYVSFTGTVLGFLGAHAIWAPAANGNGDHQ